MLKKNHQSTSSHEKIVFALQGGGALGGYQVGVVEELLKAGYEPHWVAGTSIGSINAAIIVGNKPKDRIQKLHDFWELITTKHFNMDTQFIDDTFRRYYNLYSAMHTFCFGQSGFFSPRVENPWFMNSRPATQISYYDFQPLKKTLLEFVDFDLINSGKIRFSVGAVQVESGKQIYFDNSPPNQPVGSGVEIKQCTITPEHIMASSALPPGFPAIEIDDKMYWDGGVYCNTPLAIVMDSFPRVKTLCFMLHLFDSYGTHPETLDDVMKRHKDISYSSNYRALIQMHKVVYNLRHDMYELSKILPEKFMEKPEVQNLFAAAREPTTDIVRLHYKGKDTQWSSKDAEFSQTSIQEHISIGRHDMQDALKASPWLNPIPPHIGIVVHEMTKDPIVKEFLYDK